MAFDGYCEIRRAGILPDGRAQIDIRALDGSFDWRWVFSDAARGREVLAIALTAIATNRHVGCYMTQPGADRPVLDGWFGLPK